MKVIATLHMMWIHHIKNGILKRSVYPQKNKRCTYFNTGSKVWATFSAESSNIPDFSSLRWTKGRKEVKQESWRLNNVGEVLNKEWMDLKVLQLNPVLITLKKWDFNGICKIKVSQ